MVQVWMRSSSRLDSEMTAHIRWQVVNQLDPCLLPEQRSDRGIVRYLPLNTARPRVQVDLVLGSVYAMPILAFTQAESIEW
jgi:hypothetical protein